MPSRRSRPDDSSELLAGVMKNLITSAFSDRSLVTFSRKYHRHTGMDLRHKFIRLACNNRAGAQPLSRFGIFPVFSRAAAKVNGHSSFMVIANGSFGLAVLRHS